MTSKFKKSITLFFIIFITNCPLLHAHNFRNGGCKNHCKKLFLKNKLEKKLESFNNKNQMNDNYSCLNKSLCRG